MITVVIPIYRGSLIEQVLRSIQIQQGIIVTKVILVLNQSELPQKIKYQQLAEKFPVLSIIEIETNNVSIARNKGLALSATEYTLFLDEDCIFVNTEALGKMVSLINTAGVLGVGTLFAIKDKSFKEKFYNFKINLWMQCRKNYLIAGGAGLYKTDPIKNLQFDPSIAYGGSETSLQNTIYEKSLGKLDLVCEKLIYHQVLEDWTQIFNKAKLQLKQGRRFSYIPKAELNLFLKNFLLEKDLNFFEKIKIALFLLIEKI